MRKVILTAMALLTAVTMPASSVKNPIKVNQVGYLTHESKIATIEPEAKTKSFLIRDQEGKTVWRTKRATTKKSPFSSKIRQEIDFSSITKPGRYTLVAGRHQQSFIISSNPYTEALKASIKGYYYQRSGESLERKYAGEYARPAAHLDTHVMVHPSAATTKRPAGTIISSPKGWYDAGDYNKYIVNSGFTIGLILQSYQLHQDRFNALNLQIPESDNKIPDILDEMMYNLEWMLTMQDPTDGGVYHKLTTPNFEGFVMPEDCKQQRYVVQKTTTAALDFAATMALAARIYQRFPEFQSFCRQAREAAERAYAWAVKHPTVYYDQDGNNKKFSPAIQTGGYGDNHTEDEFFWAATELYLTTSETSYLEQAKQFVPDEFSIPTWGNVAGLGIFQWVNQELLGTPDAGKLPIKVLKESLKEKCDESIKELPTSSFHSIFGNSAQDFHWGSNSESCLGRGIAQMYEYALTKDNKYRQAALSTLDYFFGRNATGYCYLTGFGTQRVMNIHHRISAADNIKEPVPGLVAGGANKGQEDAEFVPAYASNIPDESYQDNVGSYASNEIAINWNAYLVSLLGWIN